MKSLLAQATLLTWIVCRACIAQDVQSEIARLQQEKDIAAKEAELMYITQHHRDAGPQLLALAKSTNDTDTKWMAIRGIGYLKFEQAVPFLITCLDDKEHYVRANAASALAQMRALAAEKRLTRLLKSETDDGVIEQTTLALQMIKATASVQVMKARLADVSTPQARCWLIGAIEALGGRNDVPFVAKMLDGHDQTVALCAAEALQQLTGQDFDLNIPPGPSSPDLSKAKSWWKENSKTWLDAKGHR